MTDNPKPYRVVIMGAAGRDFHNFNMVYRDDPTTEVIAFTAAQIPDIAGRCYPLSLAGPRYPNGIQILDESELATLCRDKRVDRVVFAYSDVDHAQVMHKASIVLASGADFLLLGPEHTMLQAKVPVIATSAVRTGCGKSQTTLWLSRLLKQHDLKVAVIRHPMPYGDLQDQAVQRFASKEDLAIAQCTIEEREEYEPHLAVGNVVYAGVDYAAIVTQAEAEADILLWDGGNNDFPFIRPDLHLVLVDPLRPGNETTHHPGEAVLRMAEIIDPRRFAVKEINAVYKQYPHIGTVLPAVGYHSSQLQALRETINSSDADIVVVATPCDLGALIEIDKPVVRVRYEFAEVGEPKLSELVEIFLSERNLVH